MIQFRSTLQEKPVRLLLYGIDGCGKSTFASQAPRPAFIASESGLENIDAQAVFPAKWEEVLEAVDMVAASDQFESLVIDSLDWVEPLLWDFVCKQGDDKGPKNSIDEFGYGDGYVKCINQWRGLISGLDRARSKGKHIILIAHTVKKTIKNLTGEDYDSYLVKLNEKAAGVFREWCDVVGFAETEIVATKLKPRESTKGSATGRRLLRATPSAAYASKTRFAIPDRLDLNWHVFYKAVREASFTQIPKLKKELDVFIAELNDEKIAEGARAFLKARGETVAALNEAINTVRKYLKEKENGNVSIGGAKGT